MPFINLNVNTTLSREARLRIKERLGVAIELIPGKSEEWLMLQLNDDRQMFFRGTDEAQLAFVEVHLLIRQPVREHYNDLTQAITQILREELGIAAECVYISFHETRDWGYGGRLL